MSRTCKSKGFSVKEQAQPSPESLRILAGHKRINPYQCHLEEPRRVVSLFVPDDGPNGFALPGIRPGSRFKMALRTKAILG